MAFIDGVNLHKGVLRLGWKLDYKRFRAFLAERFGVRTAFLFLGYVSQNRNMYRNFLDWGYSLVFRPTCRGGYGQIKGNCDTDLAVEAVSGCCDNRYDKAILVSGDGDFFSLTSFLASRGKLEAIIAPSYLSCSTLLLRSGASLTLIESLRRELEYPQNVTDRPTSFDQRAQYFPFRSGQAAPGVCSGQINRRRGSANTTITKNPQ